MIDYTIYKTSTGSIVQSGNAPDLNQWLDEGESIIEGASDPNTQCVKDGVIVTRLPQPYPWMEWDGEEWYDPRTPEQVAADLETYRKDATTTVNRETGKIRSKYITAIEGQEMLYLDKEREAVAFLSDPEPNVVDYPFISREVGVTATTAQELAQIWLNSAFMWRQVAAELEKQRFEAINAIAIATTYEEIEATVDQFKTDVSIY